MSRALEFEVRASLLWTGGIAAISGRQRQSRGSTNHFAFLVRKDPFEAVRVDDALALVGRHRSHILDRLPYEPLAVRRKLAHLVVYLTRLLLLRGGQMLPGLHAVQDVQLLLWRKIRKTLQPLTQLLLPFRR